MESIDSNGRSYQEVDQMKILKQKLWICLAPIRNAVNRRVSGPSKTGKVKKNTITLRKEPSKGKPGRHFCAGSARDGENKSTKFRAKICEGLQNSRNLR